jgi:hypothetical protein
LYRHTAENPEIAEFSGSGQPARTCNSLCFDATFCAARRSYQGQAESPACRRTFRLRLPSSKRRTLEIEMLNKPLAIAVIATTLTSVTLAAPASANGDPALGALLGAGIGAAIGSSVNHHNGAWVGGAIGAVAGASIAASAGGYYGPPNAGYASSYYGAPAPAYYPGSTAYYGPAPAYYAPPLVVYRPRPVYVGAYRSYGPRPYPIRYPAPGGPNYGHGGGWQQPGHGGQPGNGGYPGNHDH